MANKGNSRHMKSRAAPKYFGVERKSHYYVIKPDPGRHTGQTSAALEFVLKKLDVASTKNEASKLLKGGAIAVNGRMIREPKYPVGLNDTVSLPKEQKSYKIGIDELGKMSFGEQKSASDSRICRVVGKFKTKKGVIMARLHDGSNMAASNDIRVNDSVAIEKGKIAKIMPMKVGAECTVIGGVHVGATGKIKEIKKGTINIVPTALVAPESGEPFETLIKNIMISG